MSDEDDKKTDGPACDCGGGSCCGGSPKWIWIVLALAIVGVLIAKNAGKKEAAPVVPAAVSSPAVVQPLAGKAIPEAAKPEEPLPGLVDLGAGECVACKALAPILEDLRTNYTGRLDVQFIDVWKQPQARKDYGIKLIPTQIFFSADGKELFRHEGFFSKEDILAKWKEFGVELKGN